jgi:hypothetical protein
MSTLEVGKNWINGFGETVTIVECDKRNNRWYGETPSSRMVYAANGECVSSDDPRYNIMYKIFDTPLPQLSELPSNMIAVKHDSTKPDLSLIPYEAEVAMAAAFQVGVGKYGRDNYKKGMEASRLIGAARRHLGAWFDNREECCPVDGQPHLGAALACIAMIIELQRIGKLKDNRYKPESKA